MELLQAMKVFSAVAKLGSFTNAAEVLQVGRPHVTRYVQELEAALGVRLFQRTTRSVKLTAEGEQFYARTEEILAGIDDATTMFSQSSEAMRGRLRVDLPAALSQQKFLDRLHAFSHQYPGLDLVLGVTDRTVDLVAEGVDCVLRIGDLPDSSLVGRRVGAAVMVMCASPSYLAEYGTPASLSDLAAHKGIHFLSGHDNRPLAWRFLEDGQEQTAACSVSISVNESNAYVRCGVAGFGLIQVPGILVERQLAEGALVEVLAPCRPTPWPVSLLYPSRQYVSPRVRLFSQWLIDELVSLDETWFVPRHRAAGKPE
ncbi:Transcriptional regulator, LysR family [Paraburkholderia unamae]|uniref:LysR family transcriptional regulator n=1 Tax=Paraburkholderia unamae TaxID=219649 RepID=UPI001CAE964F|nr:LysR family transcriptional regulator [Paraburkholderia unamae]CAG9273688.1 Transcriptional regulator, LysR family [Paraburkholderia unamae]